MSPTGASCWPAPDRTSSQTQRHFGVHRLDAPGRYRATPFTDDQRCHDRVRPGRVRRRSGSRVAHGGPTGDGWRLAMTVVSHEREPSTWAARYGKRWCADGRPGSGQGSRGRLAWAAVQAEILRLHVRRRCVRSSSTASNTARTGSLDKLLMTWVEHRSVTPRLPPSAPTTTSCSAPTCTAARRRHGRHLAIRRTSSRQNPRLGV